MSLFGDTAQALMVMKADVSDLRAKLRTVAADEKAVVQASIAAAEARNKSIERWTAGLAKVNVAMALASKAVSFAADAWKVYDEQLDLAAGSAQFNIAALRKASLGMKTDTELMRLGVAASTTTFKLSQQQLENVLKAQIAWEDQGKDSKLVQEALESAITKGSIRPLKELGVNLVMATGKGEAFAQVMSVIAGKAKEGEAHQIDANDAFKQAGVEWQNAMTKLKSAIGGIVVALAPLISALSDVVGLVADIASNAKEGLGRIFGNQGDKKWFEVDRRLGGDGGAAGRAMIAEYAKRESTLNPTLVPGSSEWIARDRRENPGKYNERLPSAAAGGFLGIQSQAAIEKFAFGLLGGKPDAWNIFDEKTPKPKKGGRKGGKKKDKNPIGFIEIENTGEIVPIWGPIGDFGQAMGRSEGMGLTAGQLVEGSRRNDRVALDDKNESERFAKQIEALKEFSAEGIFQEDKSLLEKALGPIDEFSAYGTAFEVLSGTLQAGFDAWVNASGSASEAMKAFAKSAVAGVASQMFSQALLHGAHAIGELAIGISRGPLGAKNFAAASVHAKAALAFGAGAALLGSASRGMSGAATPSTASGGRAPTIGDGRASESDGGNRSITVVIGETFGDDSPRQRSSRVASAIRRARRELDDNKGVSSS